MKELRVKEKEQRGLASYMAYLNMPLENYCEATRVLPSVPQEKTIP